MRAAGTTHVVYKTRPAHGTAPDTPSAAQHSHASANAPSTGSTNTSTVATTTTTTTPASAALPSRVRHTMRPSSPPPARVHVVSRKAAPCSRLSPSSDDTSERSGDDHGDNVHTPVSYNEHTDKTRAAHAAATASRTAHEVCSARHGDRSSSSSRSGSGSGAVVENGDSDAADVNDTMTAAAAAAAAGMPTLSVSERVARLQRATEQRLQPRYEAWRQKHRVPGRPHTLVRERHRPRTIANSHNNSTSSTAAANTTSTTTTTAATTMLAGLLCTTGDARHADDGGDKRHTSIA